MRWYLNIQPNVKRHTNCDSSGLCWQMTDTKRATATKGKKGLRVGDDEPLDTAAVVVEGEHSRGKRLRN